MFLWRPPSFSSLRLLGKGYRSQSRLTRPPLTTTTTTTTTTRLLTPTFTTAPPARSLVTSAMLRHEDPALKDVPETITVHFIVKSGARVTVLAKEGENALRLAQRFDVQMEGACEASLACTTCHCYVDSERHWDMLPEATEVEEDLLDMAPFLSTNSRLGCEIVLTADLDGIELRLPRATKNFYVDGHTPTPH